jgi:hypothetical protein
MLVLKFIKSKNMRYIPFFFSFLLITCKDNRPEIKTQWEMTDIVNVQPEFKNQFKDTLADVYYEYYVRIENLSSKSITIDSNSFIEIVDNRIVKLIPINNIDNNHLPLPKFKIGSKKEVQLVLKSNLKLNWKYNEKNIINDLVKPSKKKLAKTKLFYISIDDTIRIFKTKDYFIF